MSQSEAGNFRGSVWIAIHRDDTVGAVATSGIGPTEILHLGVWNDRPEDLVPAFNHKTGPASLHVAGKYFASQS